MIRKLPFTSKLWLSSFFFFGWCNSPTRTQVTLFLGSYITHTRARARPVELPWMGDQFVAETTIYKSHNQYMRRKSMPSAGFEPAIRAIQRPQTYVLDRTANRIDHDDLITLLFFHFSGRIVNFKKFLFTKNTPQTQYISRRHNSRLLCVREASCVTEISFQRFHFSSWNHTATHQPLRNTTGPYVSKAPCAAL
jgi:hypothetical protein